MAELKAQISDDQVRQFRDQGYLVLDQHVPPEHIQLLRDVCDDLIAETDRDIDAGRTDHVQEITHKGKRYFIDGACDKRPELSAYVFSEYMANVCRATIGPNAYLFKNQYVVKCAEVGMKFSWHQDSGYIAEPHRPYLTTWCALDDVSEQNGTIYIKPRSAGDELFMEHRRDERTKDLVGYSGDDLGVPVIMHAGGLVAFSSTTLHRSGANNTNRIRRVYLAAYSAEPMPLKKGTTRQAIPFLENGELVVPAAC